MTTLIAILLYLTYLIWQPEVKESYIRDLQIRHEAEIKAVELNPERMQVVEREWMDDASKIVVVNDFEQE